MQKSRLYVSGLWIIRGNAKRDKKHYDNLLDPTFEIVRGQNVLFFSDDQQILEQAKRIAERYNIHFYSEYLEIENLPNAELSRQIADNACRFRAAPFEILVADGTISKEMGLYASLHYTGDKQRDERFSKMTQIYLSKPGLLNRAAQKYDHKEFIWFDASVSRFRQSRAKADFTKWKLESDRIHHYGSIMKFYGRSQPLNGSVLAGDRNAVERLNTLFQEQCLFYAQSGCTYPTDDEYIHMLCYKISPELYKDVNFKRRNIAQKIIGKLIYVTGLTSFFAKALNNEMKLIKKIP